MFVQKIANVIQLGSCFADRGNPISLHANYLELTMSDISTGPCSRHAYEFGECAFPNRWAFTVVG